MGDDQKKNDPGLNQELVTVGICACSEKKSGHQVKDRLWSVLIDKLKQRMLCFHWEALLTQRKASCVYLLLLDVFTMCISFFNTTKTMQGLSE